MSDLTEPVSDAAQSDVGRVRRANEDAFLADRGRCVWAVADGMGGHENGQWAAQSVIDALRSAQFSGEFDSDALVLAEALHSANERIYRQAVDAGKSMGSTVAALLLRRGRFAAVWAGDSRVYLLRDGALYRLTHDHSQVQEMVDDGVLSPEEARGHPMANVVTRAVGVDGSLQVDVVVDDSVEGDRFMLCSDGLHGVVNDSEIADRLADLDPQSAVATLLELTLLRGAPDNVTIVAVAVGAEPLSSRSGTMPS